MAPPALRILRGVSFLLALLLGGWALWVAVIGGTEFAIFHHTIASHDPWRPALGAVAALAVFVAAKGRRAHVRAWLATVDVVGDRLITAALGVALCAVGIAYATTAASGSDAYGYVSEADGWITGRLKIPEPWAANAPWPDALLTFSPLGYRPGAGADAASIVPSYSPGLPLLFAAAKTVGGQEGMFWVVPISGAVLVLATFGIGRRLGAPRAGLVAAWLVATSPIVLFMIVAPMTDIPVAAAWNVALYFILGESASSSAAAGVAAAVAILIRPNLVFEAGPLGVWYLLRAWRTGAWGVWIGRAAIFSACTASGIVAVAAINAYLYGSPFVSGYGTLGGWFTLGNIGANARNYTRWFAFAHTPVALVGLVPLLLPLKRFWPGVKDRAVFVVIGLFLIALVGQYFAFLVFDEWWYLRFLITGLPIVLIGVGVVATWLARGRRPVLTLAVIAAVVTLGARDFKVAAGEQAFEVWQGERRYVSVAKIARSMTDPASVIVCMQHSGTLRYYGGRMTLQYAVLPNGSLDQSVAWLAAHGAHPYLLLEEWEIEPFKARFPGQQTLSVLSGRPLFMYEGPALVMMYDLASSPTDPAPPTVNVVETYADRERSVPPAPFPAFTLK